MGMSCLKKNLLTACELLADDVPWATMACFSQNEMAFDIIKYVCIIHNAFYNLKTATIYYRAVQTLQLFLTFTHT